MLPVVDHDLLHHLPRNRFGPRRRQRRVDGLLLGLADVQHTAHDLPSFGSACPSKRASCSFKSVTTSARLVAQISRPAAPCSFFVVRLRTAGVTPSRFPEQRQNGL